MKKAKSDSLPSNSLYDSCVVSHNNIELLTVDRCRSKTETKMLRSDSMKQLTPNPHHHLESDSSTSIMSNCSSNYNDGNCNDLPRHRNASTKMAKRNIRFQVKRFRMETKAAKTLGIIVGAFILCWFPFFTIYVVRGFCPECINPLLWSVLFWLGYCNSAVNPFIYAMFSKDFRAAFTKILCKCICIRSKQKSMSLRTPTIYIPNYVEAEDSDEIRGCMSVDTTSVQ